MQKVEFPKTANVHFLETLEGKLVSFQPSQPIYIATGEPDKFEIILVTDNKLTFRIEAEQAKGLLKQLQNSIAVCECYNG